MSSSRRGSDEFEFQWNELYISCSGMITTLLDNLKRLDTLIKIYGTSKDSLEIRKTTDKLIIDTVQLITKLSVDVIKLSETMDAKLNLSVEQLNNLTFDRIDSSFEDLSPKLIDKKRSEMKLSKEFKKAVHRFKEVQKSAIDKSKEFVLKAKTATLRRGKFTNSLPQRPPRQEKTADKLRTPADLAELPVPKTIQASIAVMEDHSAEISTEECQLLITQKESEIEKMEKDFKRMESVIIDLSNLERTQRKSIQLINSRRSSKYAPKSTNPFARMLQTRACWTMTGIASVIAIVIVLTSAV